MKTKIVTTALMLLSVLMLYAENPSSENYILQQWGFASGNDPANPPTSTNYVLTGSAVGIISDEDVASSNYNLMPGYYLGPIEAGILPPQNVVIAIVGTQVQITWNAVSGATSYKVYSSDNPYIGFTEDVSGNLTGTSWTAQLTGNMKFYYITAVNSERETGNRK